MSNKTYLKIFYKSDGDFKKDSFEDEIESLMESYGYQNVGSGYDFEKEERDLEFVLEDE